MARLAALGRVHSDGGRRRPVASAGNSIPVSAPNPKSRSIAYCSSGVSRAANLAMAMLLETRIASAMVSEGDQKSTRLNSSHLVISYAVFCLKKKKNKRTDYRCSLTDQSQRDARQRTIGSRALS